MEKMIQECVKPHALIHTITGMGLGLLLTVLVPSLGANAMMLGAGFILVGGVSEFVVKK